MSATADFAINGRFFGQALTGVQRYARNVVAYLDAQAGTGGPRIDVIAPKGTEDPGLRALGFRTFGVLSGHAWEQAELPLATPARLLNLCNTAPVSKRGQIVCVHDANVFLQPQSYSCAFRALYRTLHPLLARRAARIATVSNAAAWQIARHLPIRLDDIAVLPNGHEHALAWDPARSALAHAQHEILNRGFVLVLGSRAPHKNLQLMADIAPALDELGLDVVVAGGGGHIFAAEDAALPSNVKQLGRVSDDDLAYLMDHAVCLAFPSWTEGFGLPIVEAMARGCPVISSDRASMPEVCGKAALLASPADPAAWVRRIRALRDEPALRQELIGRGRERARLFSWAQTAAGYMDLLEQPQRSLPARDVPPARGTARIAVIFATRGRPEIVSATVRHLLMAQTLKPACVILSCIDAKDAGDLIFNERVTVVIGPEGAAAQRNTGLAQLPADIDIVAFFDDDFVADANWLAVAARVFREEPDVVSLTGRVIVDDVKGPGLDFRAAAKIVEDEKSPLDWTFTEPFSPYGCNMAFRRSAIGDLRFDERLILYAWLEDRDFGARLAKRGGRLVKCAAARGVHMGVKGGRVAGEKLGYSQVINPFYLLRKGAMTRRQVADHVLRNIASNLLGALRPEPYVDRRGRLRGNMAGLRDLLAGRRDPERAVNAVARQDAARTSATRRTRTAARASAADGSSDGVIPLLRSVTPIVWRQKYKLAAWVFFCLTAAFLLTRTLPQLYTSTTTLILDPREQLTNAERSGASTRPMLDVNRADSELQVFRSERLLTEIFDSLSLKDQEELKPSPPSLLRQLASSVRSLFAGSERSSRRSLSPEEVSRQIAFANFEQRFSARRVGLSFVIELSYASSDPELAARVANAAASAYLRQSVAIKADEARTSAEFVQGRLDALSAQVKAAERGVKAGTLPDISMPDADARVIGAGIPALTPSSPRTGLIVAFGGILGIVSGLFTIAMSHALNPRIRLASEASAATGIACLATLPKVCPDTGAPPLTDLEMDRMVAAQPKSAFASAMRDLRAGIALVQPRRKGATNPVIAVTAWAEGSGCSTICMNLARLLQKGGRQVTVIDADARGNGLRLRHPDPDGAASFAGILLGATDIAEIRYQDIDGIAFLPALSWDASLRERDADPASPALARLCERTQNRSVVLLDLPPLGQSGDARILARQADGVIIVAVEDETPVAEVREAIGLLADANAQVIGIVINQASA